MSRLQDIVVSAVQFWFPNQQILINHRPPWLFGMELDIYLPELNIAIEVQGRQHYQWIPDLHPTLESHQLQRQRDNQKRCLCGKHGIRIILCKEHHKRCFGGLPLALKKARFRLRNLPQSIKSEWETHRKILAQLADRAPRIKVRKKGVCAINRAGSDYLKSLSHSSGPNRPDATCGPIPITGVGPNANQATVRVPPGRAGNSSLITPLDDRLWQVRSDPLPDITCPEMPNSPGSLTSDTGTAVRQTHSGGVR